MEFSISTRAMHAGDDIYHHHVQIQDGEGQVWLSEWYSIAPNAAANAASVVRAELSRTGTLRRADGGVDWTSEIGTFIEFN